MHGFLLFPGQGSQAVGMAQDAYEAGGHARALFEEASEILGYDLPQMVFSGDAETLNRTENTQPALLVASIALLETLREQVRLETTGAAGHSLGEYAALVALEAIDFADAVRLVRTRGELMARAGGDDTGMSAVIGLDASQVEEVCAKASATATVVAANYNAPGQVVISGQKAGLEKAAEGAKAAGAKRVLPLKVSAAFHSPLMEGAREGLRAALAEVPIRAPQGTFVNNADAAVLSDPEAIRESLARQMVSPVRWEPSMRCVLETGERWFFEVGPGKVLAGLMKRIDADASVMNVHSLEAVAALAADE